MDTVIVLWCHSSYHVKKALFKAFLGTQWSILEFSPVTRVGIFTEHIPRVRSTLSWLPPLDRLKSRLANQMIVDTPLCQPLLVAASLGYIGQRSQVLYPNRSMVV